jgi:hypothetical protein
MKLKFHKMQLIAGVVILVAVFVNFMDLLEEDYRNNYITYMFLFLGSSCIDVFSHAIKESVVRNHPVVQPDFNFTVALAQVVCGAIMMPLILSISMKYESFEDTHM